jgi:hypothetical protein
MPNEMFGYGFRNPIRVCRTSTLGRLVQVARAALVLAGSMRGSLRNRRGRWWIWEGRGGSRHAPFPGNRRLDLRGHGPDLFAQIGQFGFASGDAPP